jgi:hypothetical protein
MIRPTQLVVFNVGLKQLFLALDAARLATMRHSATECVNKAFGSWSQFVTLRFKFGFLQFIPTGDRGSSIGLPLPDRKCPIIPETTRHSAQG